MRLLFFLCIAIQSYGQITITASTNNPRGIDLIQEGGVYGQDNHTLIQQLINDNPGRKIIIGRSVNDLVYISKPLVLVSNTILEINATLKLTNGVVRSLTQNAATGQNRVYVDNLDGAYTVGQLLTVGATNYPTGGGGDIARKMGQSGKVTVATTTYVEFESNLRATLSGVSVGDLLTSNSATIGHAQTMFYAKNVNNITIRGTGLIDGNFSTMQNTYHPCDIGSSYSALAGYESSMGGNAMVFWNCDNITVKGYLPTVKLSLQEFNIGAILAVEVNDFVFSNLSIYHPYMKHLAFSLGNDNGLCEDNVFDTSYNEDGLSLHDLVTNSTFKRITISDCPRIGLGVGTGSNYNLFEDITITNCNLSLYTYPSTGSELVHDNYFRRVAISYGTAGVILAMTYNTTFEDLTVSYNGISNHCITMGGACHDITFTGGGAYDTFSNSNNGFGYRTVAKETWHSAESYNISFNNFEFLRLKQALYDVGSSTATFTSCIFDDNASNGDIGSADFTFITCTVDGVPYP